jgi:hypothetical protein
MERLMVDLFQKLPFHLLLLLQQHYLEVFYQMQRQLPKGHPI